MIITIQHLRTVPAWSSRRGYCSIKSREFFKRYNLDWNDFIHNGIEDKILLATGNALAIHLVEYAQEQQKTFSNKQLMEALEEFGNGR